MAGYLVVQTRALCHSLSTQERKHDTRGLLIQVNEQGGLVGRGKGSGRNREGLAGRSFYQSLLPSIRGLVR